MFFSCRDSCSYSSDRWRGLHRRSEEGMKPHQSDENHSCRTTLSATTAAVGIFWLIQDEITRFSAAKTRLTSNPLSRVIRCISVVTLLFGISFLAFYSVCLATPPPRPHI